MQCFIRPGFLRVGVVALLAAALAPAWAQDEAPERIDWNADLPAARRAAKTSGRVVMVCINAKRVDGREVDEPAAKGLREVVYPDPRVVKVSRDLECVLLTKEGNTAEYDALRALGVSGSIISPQHVFISPEGDKILLREEYWPHGEGEQAVEMMIQLMNRAKRIWEDPDAAAEEAAKSPEAPVIGDPGAPEDGPERAAWIAERVAKITATGKERDIALAELVAADKDGDCVDLLIAAMPEHKKDVSALWGIVRALGKPGLERAALPVAEQLKHKELTIVANAAVSLEYIGSADKKVITALRRVAEKHKDAGVANHAYRALGRCGREDTKVRSLLLKQAGSAKSEYASYGPLIGLAYFEGDEKAMRGVEKLLKQLGVPGGRRGGGTNAVKRGLASWTLACIGDAKSAEFMDAELIAGLKNVKAFWVPGLVTFWETVAEVCDGARDRLPEVEAGVGVIVRFSKGGNLERYGAETRPLMDEARKGRDGAGFEPRGDGILDVE